MLNLYIKGPDQANARIACPPPSPLTNTHVSEMFFHRLSQRCGLPTVPVINSGNRYSIMVGQSTDENAAASMVHIHLAELK